MEKEYIFGYLPSEADKMTLDEIYTYLIDKGVIDNTVSKNDLAIILEGVIKSITPDMIRGNVTIAGVTGNVATKVEEIYVDKFDEVEPQANVYTLYTRALDGNYSYIAKNGIDKYMWYSNANSYSSGITHVNLTTEEKTLLYPTGYNTANIVELDDGSIYFIPTSTTSRFKYMFYFHGNTCTNMGSIPSQYKRTNDKLYICSSGIFLVSKTTRTRLINSGDYRIYTGSNNICYLYPYNSGAGIYTLDLDTSAVEFIGGEGSGYSNQYELPDGVTIFSKPSAVIAVKGTDFLYYVSGFSGASGAPIFTFIMPGTNGAFYSSSNNSYAEYVGLYYTPITGETTKIYDSGYTWNKIIPGQNDDLYIYSNSNNTKGLLYVNNDTAHLLYDKGYSWGVYYEASDGTIYISSSSSDSESKGLIRIKNGTASLIYDLGYNWSNFFETSDGTIYVSSGYTKGLLQIIGDTATLIYDNGYSWKYIQERETCTYIIGGTGILKVTGSTCKAISTSNTYVAFHEFQTRLYCTVSSSSGYTVRINEDDTITTIATNATKFYESITGKLYLGGNTYIYKIEGDTVSQLFYHSDLRSVYFTELPTGDIITGNSSNITSTSCTYAATINTDETVTILLGGGRNSVKSRGYSYIWSSYGDSTNPTIICISPEKNISLIRTTLSYTYFVKSTNDYIYLSTDNRTKGVYTFNKDQIIQLADTGGSYSNILTLPTGAQIIWTTTIYYAVCGYYIHESPTDDGVPSLIPIQGMGANLCVMYNKENTICYIRSYIYGGSYNEYNIHKIDLTTSDGTFPFTLTPIFTTRSLTLGSTSIALPTGEFLLCGSSSSTGGKIDQVIITNDTVKRVYDGNITPTYTFYNGDWLYISGVHGTEKEGTLCYNCKNHTLYKISSELHTFTHTQIIDNNTVLCSDIEDTRSGFTPNDLYLLKENTIIKFVHKEVE